MDSKTGPDILQAFEKENRMLRKKLDRCSAERKLLESDIASKEFLLNQIIHELKISQENLTQNGQELEATLHSLHAMQTQMLQSEKMSALGQMVAGIAHEINNPVSFIHGNLTPVTQYMQDILHLLQLYDQEYPIRSDTIQAQRDAIDINFLIQDLPLALHSMRVGTQRIRDIVLSLRNFSRLDEGDFKAVDLHEGIDNTLLIVQHRLNATDKRPEIQVVKNYAALPKMVCCAGQINQVFMNLLINAIDALDDCPIQIPEAEPLLNGGQITIRTFVQESWVCVAIADNGTGIPEPIQRQIFDPFFTTKAVGKGTGMGLSISYQIITENHGGQLTCISSPNVGTEFTIHLPMQPRSLGAVRRAVE